MNSQLTLEKMHEHFGHKVVIAKYGDQNYSLECETCNEVLADADMEDKTQEVLEHGLILNSETMSFYDESGNEYRDENGQAIYYSEVDTAKL